MPPQRPQLHRPCIFCEAEANSREHAIPKWVGKRLGFSKERLNIFIARQVEPRNRRKHQPVNFGSHRAKIVCRGCNAHFSNLENEAIPYLAWMARGRDLRLEPEAQSVLARWGAKTAYALLAASVPEFQSVVPKEHRHLLRETGDVHPLTWVGYASWYLPAISLLAGQGMIVGHADQLVPDSYGIVLAFPTIALKVFGIHAPVPGSALKWDTPGVAQVAPRLGRPLTWPTLPLRDNSQGKEFMDEIPLTRHRTQAA